ncbi:MAG: hypothetical protein WCR08_03370 [Gammaproteobacteria bacterium]
MNTHLTAGIVQNIIVGKERVVRNGLAVESIVEKLKEEINVGCFNFSEDEDAYYWKIIPNILEMNLVEFLDAQFQMYNQEKTKEMEEALIKVRLAKSGDELMLLAASKELEFFRLITHLTNYLKVMRHDSFEARIPVNYHLIAFFVGGKTIMESYDKILGYFEASIRLQKESHPVAECVKIMISK